MDDFAGVFVQVSLCVVVLWAIRVFGAYTDAVVQAAETNKLVLEALEKRIQSDTINRESA